MDIGPVTFRAFVHFEWHHISSDPITLAYLIAPNFTDWPLLAACDLFCFRDSSFEASNCHVSFHRRAKEIYLYI